MVSSLPMNLPRSLIGCFLLTALSAFADNPYDYRYGTAAYERAMASRRSDERLNAPVTNSPGITVDFSATLSEIRKVMGTKLTPEQIVLARRRAQEEARRAASEDDDTWVPAAPAARAPEPPREISYTERLQNLAREGNSEAQYILGSAQITVDTFPDVQAQGLRYLEDSARRGNEKAVRALIAHYDSHPKLNRFPRALELMTDLAERGDAEYTRQLGQAYLNGVPDKIAPDAAKAFHFLNAGLTRWADGTCGLTLARAYRDGKLFPQDTAKAIATYRQLIEAQSKRQDTMKPPRYNAGVAGWEWFQLVKAQDPDLASVDPQILALWDYAALHGEPHTRAATHRLAAELGRFYEAGNHGPRNLTKAILFLSIATSGTKRGAASSDYDDVVLATEDQARHLYVLAKLLLDVAPAWPRIDHNHVLVASIPADIARLYTLACSYASQPDEQGNFHPCPSPFLALYHLSFDENYGLALNDNDRLALLDKALDLGDTPNDPEHPDHADYAELLYERARLVRALGEIMPDTQHRAALGFEKAWEYGYLPAALPLAELIDDGRLPPKKRAEAEAICRLAAEKGDAFCAAQLGTWLAGEIAAQAKPDPALVAETKDRLAQAIAAKIDHAYEDAAVLDAATGDYAQAAAHFDYVLKAAPSPRAKAGLAELVATGKGGLKADPAAALKLLDEAAEEDGLYAIRLAEIFQQGEWGAPKDPKKAIDLLDRALMRDNEWRAGLVLARIYHTGTDVEKDEAKAWEYLEAAGARGNNETARLIAEAFEKGDIINRNLDSASFWRNAAIHGLVLDPG